MNFVTLTVLLIYQVYGLTFPKKFKFGLGTSAYQVEGAWNESGKGPHIWDWMTHTYPTFISDLSNGDVACDAYHKTETDVKLLRNVKADFYRFSISWARIFPNGQTNTINSHGVRHYNKFIDLLLANNIEPIVTMYHFDLPLGLHQLGGWPNIALADYFVDYADKLFSLFGDRVKTWITFNQLQIVCEDGYSTGDMAPGYKQLGIGGYMCGHTVLIAHARTYRLYERKYKHRQRGSVGLSVVALWFEPAAEGEAYVEAAETSMQFTVGWSLHPIYKGDYPPVMRNLINTLSAQQNYTRSRLPYFTKAEIKLIKGTADFIGINHYTSSLCLPLDNRIPNLVNPDTNVTCYQPTTWTSTASSTMKVTPWGFRKILNWIKKEYGNPQVLVTENGYVGSTSTLQDCNRVNYFNSYLSELLNAIKLDGCNVQAYTAWSFMDNFEWTDGYTQKFGVHYVNFSDPNRTRAPKMSAYVLKNIIKTRKIDANFTPKGFQACPAS